MPPHDSNSNKSIAAARAERSKRCVGDVSLPVVDDSGRLRGSVIRASKNWPKRVIVLTLVHVFLIAHIVLWVVSGRTTTPIEPSEAMEFTRSGVINMGLIFFAIALLSTLILGRWFCGWGCHVVFLQDICGWIMRKLGVQPKPFRSRLLIYVPFILAMYMFIWPAVYRWGIAPLVGTADRLPAWTVQAHLTTEDFWRTFPGVMVAIPFFLICGFAAVYFLGAKGFCTYGCPYGGFFAPLDRFARGRIRVTDDCEQCGHCTAVCTSNVRVHDEVREYGMVVDPGCMKCLDCVSVCPKNALYFGFGPTPRQVGANRDANGPRSAPHPKLFSRYDLTWPEEIIFAIVFLLTFIVFRGLYGLIPMLMAAGMAGVTTFLLWKLWRIARDANVSFLRYRLRMHGSVTREGVLFATIGLLVMLFTLHAGAVRGSYQMADHFDRQVEVSMDEAFFGDREAIVAEHGSAAARGLRWYNMADAIGPGRIGLHGEWQAELDLRRAWLHIVQGEFEQADALLRSAAERDGMRDSYAEGIFMIHLTGQPPEAIEAAFAFADDVLLKHESLHRLLDRYVQLAAQLGQPGRAREVCEARRERFPDDVPTLRWLALLKLDAGDFTEGIELLKRAIDRSPRDVHLRSTLVMALAQSGRMNDAHEALAAALDVMPDSPQLNEQMAMVLTAMGRHEEAEQYRKRAQELTPQPDPMEGYQSPIAE